VKSDIFGLTPLVGWSLNTIIMDGVKTKECERNMIMFFFVISFVLFVFINQNLSEFSNISPKIPIKKAVLGFIIEKISAKEVSCAME
jgi:hypothetical protein